MAQKKYTELGAGSAPDGNEITAAVQGGVSKRFTFQQIADLATGTGTVESVTGDGVDNTDPDNPVISFPTAGDIGLGNVNNTSDANKPVSTAQQTALDLKAAIASPTFTGVPAAPTAATTTNTTQLATTAFVQQEITERVIGLQDLFISAAAMWPRSTNGCAALAQTEVATSLFNIQTLDFDQTTQEFAQFQISLPRNWNNGTITAKVYWTASSGSGTVQWGISGGAYSNDDALTVALGTAQTVDDTLIATNDLHITDATSAITLAGTPADADFLAIQVSRNPASDTLSADAKLLGVVITITTDAAKAA